MGQQDDPNTGAGRNDGEETPSQPAPAGGGGQNEGIEDMGQGGREVGSGGAQQEGAWRPADAGDDTGQNPTSRGEDSPGPTGGGSGPVSGGTGDDAGDKSDEGIGSAQGGA